MRKEHFSRTSAALESAAAASAASSANARNPPAVALTPLSLCTLIVTLDTAGGTRTAACVCPEDPASTPPGCASVHAGSASVAVFPSSYKSEVVPIQATTESSPRVLRVRDVLGDRGVLVYVRCASAFAFACAFAFGDDAFALWLSAVPGGESDAAYGFCFTSSAPVRSRGSIAKGMSACPSVEHPNPRSPTPPPAMARISESAARSASAAGNAFL